MAAMAWYGGRNASERWKIVRSKIPWKDITREDRQLAEGKTFKRRAVPKNIVQIFDMGQYIDNEWFYIEWIIFQPKPRAKLDDSSVIWPDLLNGCSGIYRQCSVLCIIWPNTNYQYPMEI